MALIKCADCSTDVSDQAEKCPKCGRPIGDAEPGARATRGSNTVFYAVIGFAVGFVLAWGGCAKFGSIDARDATIFAFGGVVCALVGALIGANVKAK